MDSNVTPLERAFALAESGTCPDVATIRRQLKTEGYSDAQLVGGHLLAQLRGKIKAAVGTPQTRLAD
jgi:hypothetical protein